MPKKHKVHKKCGNWGCDNASKRDAMYCQNPECVKIGTARVWKEKELAKFGDALDVIRHCDCGNQLIRRDNEPAQNFLKRESCSMICARYKVAKSKGKVKYRTVKEQANLVRTQKNETIGQAWDKRLDSSKLIHRALSSPMMC